MHSYQIYNWHRIAINIVDIVSRGIYRDTCCITTVAEIRSPNSWPLIPDGISLFKHGLREERSQTYPYNAER